MRFTLKDFFFCLATGLITGFIAWRVAEFNTIPRIYGMPWIVLLLLVPIVWMIGVNLGYFLSRWMAFFNQFGKFAAIGFTNAAVDIGVLNLLISLTGISSGGTYTVYKTISFLVAVIPSYVWNKSWAFDAARSRNGTFEFVKFIIVAVISVFVNVIAASIVNNHIHPLGALTLHQWATVAAITGSAASLFFSFIGFKLAVFKK